MGHLPPDTSPWRAALKGLSSGARGGCAASTEQIVVVNGCSRASDLLRAPARSTRGPRPPTVLDGEPGGYVSRARPSSPRGAGDPCRRRRGRPAHAGCRTSARSSPRLVYNHASHQYPLRRVLPVARRRGAGSIFLPVAAPAPFHSSRTTDDSEYRFRHRFRSRRLAGAWNRARPGGGPRSSNGGRTWVSERPCPRPCGSAWLVLPPGARAASSRSRSGSIDRHTPALEQEALAEA